jgi:2-polyprenyl-3-methyl-5-hydroxy-6-metoxy-1,4-benzoquinol methylase
MSVFFRKPSVPLLSIHLEDSILLRTIMARTDTATSFDRMYARQEPAYGFDPSGELLAIIEDDIEPGGDALDLGCGAGRNALAMAAAGLSVVAVDESGGGIDRLDQEAADRGLTDRIDARVEDVAQLHWADRQYDLIAAVTILDHLHDQAMKRVWGAICDNLKPTGVLLVEAHTVRDPGCEQTDAEQAPVSESAEHVIRYFNPNELLDMACRRLHVIRYEERLERDRSHGRPHRHAKASLVASLTPNSADYFGYPRHA